MKKRVERLEPAAREGQPEELVPGAAVGEEVERGARLLEHRPEQRRRQEQHRDHDQPLAFRARPLGAREEPHEEDDGRQHQHHTREVGDAHGGHRQQARVAADADDRHRHQEQRAPHERLSCCSRAAACGEAAGTGCRPLSPRCFAAQHVLHDANRHADARRGKARVPAHALAQIAAHERRQERAEVDAHVENREAGVAPLVFGRVELADDHADVALEQPGANHDQDEPEVEGHDRRHGHREVAAGDDDAAVEHGPPLPDQPIRNPAARQRGHVRHRGVEAIDGPALRRIEGEPPGRQRRRHVEQQQGAHPVVAEPLPHLGEKEDGEPARVAEKRGVSRCRVGHRQGVLYPSPWPAQSCRSTTTARSATSPRVPSHRARRHANRPPEPRATSACRNIWRATCITTCASSIAACCCHGPCRRAPRSTRATSVWPCRSRIIPSSTASFEGVIPEGYGAGVVMLWDFGTWTPESPDIDAALKKGELKFRLEGYKLKGSWALVRTRGYGGGSKPELAADQAQGRVGRPHRHRRVRAAQREDARCRLRRHPREDTPAIWHSNPPAKGGDTGKLFQRIIATALERRETKPGGAAPAKPAPATARASDATDPGEAAPAARAPRAKAKTAKTTTAGKTGSSPATAAAAKPRAPRATTAAGKPRASRPATSAAKTRSGGAR